MGRHTHEAADRPDRRRIIFSTKTEGWQRPSQLWLNPVTTTPRELPGLVGDMHPLREGLILGGTRVHDWFLDHAAIDRVHLTIEPIRFGEGLPVFTGAYNADSKELFADLGFRLLSEDKLNSAGTRYLVFGPP